MINRRRFLASSVLAALWGYLPQVAAREPRAVAWRNWSGHLVANPTAHVTPSSEQELIAYLKSTTGTIRPVGAGHSFAPLVPTDGELLVLDKLSGLERYDERRMTAELMAGTRVADAGPLLHEIGQAMPNLPDIDHQTLAGAIATSTHGTGKHLKSLSGYVSSLRLVTPTGDVIDADAHHETDVFDAGRVSLGALGVVTRIGFENRKPFCVLTRNWMEETSSVLDNFDAYADEWQHFEMMPLLHSDYSLVIAHKETSAAIEPMPAEDDDGAFLKLIDATPVALRGALINTLADSIEPTQGVDWSFNALTNLRFDRFNEMEYSVPAARGAECLMEILETVSDRGIDVTIPLEYRLIDEDDSWISMFEGGPRVSISVHRMAQYDFHDLFDAVEPIFWKYEGRPHWGKLHTLDFDRLKAIYPHLADFASLQQALDPEGRMLNPHLRKVLGR